MNVKTSKWIRIPSDQVVAEIADINGRPFIAINPLCETLGISEIAQDRRILRHASVRRMRVVHTSLPNGSTWTLIPLEFLAWFLWTLRPRSEESVAILSRWRETLTWHVIRAFITSNGTFGTAHALRQEAGELPDPPRANVWRRGKKRTVTPALIDHMRDLQRQGKSLSAIAKEVGYSTATISLCLNGKYHAVAPD